MSPTARKRLQEMESFIGTVNRWYDQMLGVPAPKIMALMPMGAKVANPVGLGRRTSKPEASTPEKLCGAGSLTQK